MFEAGFSTVDITPAIGADIPGNFSPIRSTGTVDPLQARACVLRSAENVTAIVGVDAVSLGFSTVEKARASIAAVTGIPLRNVLIAASHTHSGGPANDVLGTNADPDYCSLLSERIAMAVESAYSRLRVCEVGTATVPCPGWAFNRRFKMRSGGERTNPGKNNPDITVPAGPADPDVSLIVCREPGGAVMGVIGGFTCHCTVVGGSAFSGDYPAYWQEAMRKAYGPEFSLVFVNGACGDINQMDFLNPDVRESGSAWAGKMGQALADASVGGIDGAAYHDSGSFVTAHGEVFVEFRHPDAAALAQAAELVNSDKPWDSRKWLARDLLLLEETIGQSRGMSCPIDVFQIADAVVCAAPWQPFCEFGLKIKEQSPFPTAMIAAFANGMLGYVPTPQAFAGGGYEPTLCRGSKLIPDTGDRIVSETVRLLHALKKD